MRSTKTTVKQKEKKKKKARGSRGGRNQMEGKPADFGRSRAYSL